MISSHVKSLVIIFVLLLFIGVTTVGCKTRSDGMININSMPGHTFQKYRNYINYDNKKGNSSHTDSSDSFGPQDVSFDFKDLK